MIGPKVEDLLPPENCRLILIVEMILRGIDASGNKSLLGLFESPSKPALESHGSCFVLSLSPVSGKLRERTQDLLAGPVCSPAPRSFPSPLPPQPPSETETCVPAKGMKKASAAK